MTGRGFVIKHGDAIALTGSDNAKDWVLDVPRRMSDGAAAQTFDTTKTPRSVVDHTARPYMCNGRHDLLLTGHTTALQGANSLLLHPDADRADWVTKSRLHSRCVDQTERFQFVPQDTAYPKGAPLCPGESVMVRVNRKNNTRPFLWQAAPGKDQREALKASESHFANWKVWKTEGWTCDPHGQCKPWRMEDVPTRDRVPYACYLDVDSAGEYRCSCDTTADNYPLFSTEQECRQFCGAGNNTDNSDNGSNNSDNNTDNSDNGPNNNTDNSDNGPNNTDNSDNGPNNTDNSDNNGVNSGNSQNGGRLMWIGVAILVILVLLFLLWRFA